MIPRTIAHYRLEELAGEGAVGKVYRARDTALDRPVALKFLHPAAAADPEALDRFLREARLAATLDDPHVCTVHAIDRDETGAWYIAMNWCGGGTVAARLADGPVPPEQALAWARQTALGLAAAHRQGIVHRDIKPANLLLDDAGHVRIADFGVARLQGAGGGTRVGALTGTTAYMAPEQARGDEATAASDTWAVGVVLYELLAGDRPFRGEYEAALLYDIVHGEPPPLPAGLGPVGRRCQRIVDRCLAKDPARRFGSAAELAAALEGSLAGPRRPRRGRLLAASAAGIVLALALVAAGVRLAATRGWGERPDDRGVVVLPFPVSGADAADEALGAGLAWYLSDRLAGFDQASDAFWVVPPGDAERYGVRTAADAEEILGVRRTVSGYGRLEQGVLTLELSYRDSRQGRHVRQGFSDDAANLRTWQQDVPLWAARVLDGDIELEASGAADPAGTTVPAAFLAWLRGAGVVWSAAAARDTAVLARGVALLGRAVAADSSYARALTDWGWARHRLHGGGAEDRGLAAVRRAARAAPRAVWPRVYLAGLALGAGRPDEAAALCDSVLRLDPVNASALTTRARALAAGDRAPVAAEAWDRALHARPGYPPLLNEVGRVRYAEGDYAGARDAFAAAARVTPGNHRAHLLLGAALFQLGDTAGAADAFRRSLTIEPTSGALLNLGTIAYYEGRYADAARRYHRALDYGESHEGWKLLGEAWRWLPDHADSSRWAYGQAIALAEQRLRREPADWDLKATLASYYTARGDTAPAANLLAEIAAADPELSSEAEFCLAAACEDLGRRADALAWLGRALEGGLVADRPERYPGFRNLRADPRYRRLITGAAAVP